MTESTTTTPDLLDEARRLEALIDEHAAEGDKQGRLSDPVVDALHDARIFGMWVPKALGGSELDPVSSLKVIDQLAYADPSTGWVTMAAGLAIGTGAAYLGDQAVDEIFGGERFPVIAGQGTRPGTAVPQDGGHLLSGSWQFASGIKHSGFIHTLGVVEGTGEPRIFVLPVEQATLIDNWDVMGLRATGKRHPTVQDNVTIGSGAKLLGPITVGHGAKIGANSVVITDVPPNSTVVGNPGHIVRVAGRKIEGPDADWIHLPDPVADAIKGLAARIEALERALAEAAGREAAPVADVRPLRPAQGRNPAGG